MPTFDIVREVNPAKTFRIASLIDKFDLQNNHVSEKFVGNIDINDDWNIGLIVGNSGTGKTTIAKEMFKKNYFDGFDYSKEAVIDDMPQNKSINEIIKIFNSVGFSSPPSWLKPYKVLSNGEKMRVDLALAILQDRDCFLFDEFTSVVDRKVAQICSLAVQKAIKKTNKRFVAVSCHYDIIDWLQPDWVFDTNIMKISKKKEQDLTSIWLLENVKKKCGKILGNITI